MRSMTIGKKLLVSFGAALALTLAVSGLAMWSVDSLGGSLNKVMKVNARKLYLASEINTVMSEFTAGERGIIARGFMKDKAAMQQYHQEFRQSEDKFKKRVEEFIPLIETTEARQIIQGLQADEEQIAQLHEELYRLADAGQMEGAAAVLNDKAMPLILKSKAGSEQLMDQQSTLLAGVAKSAEDSVSVSRWLTMLMIGLSLLVGVGVVFIVRQINRSLRQTVTELNEGAAQTASAASQVSSASQSLAQGASEQAASLEETSASSEEINSMAQKNTENSSAATSLVMQSQQKFAETNQALDEMVTAMGEINASSDKISKIIKVIDEIAFQTNILALNAAVEAARAGEAGMGFAVVADEVRNLAQRCAQAAKDTAGLIEESIGKSNEGKAKVDHVALAIRAITEESAKVKTLVDEVNVGSQEQARGIQEISKAIAQMEQVTQSTAANAEESASAAEELTAQSEALRAIVERLSDMVGGGWMDARPSHRPSVVKQQGRMVSGPAAPALELQPLREPAAAKRNSIPLEEEFKAF